VPVLLLHAAAQVLPLLLLPLLLWHQAWLAQCMSAACTQF
jgi:hypothetical protein